ncbi:MAG: hypothetical protein AAF891_00550 [Pseudomonadota bacterium]
MKIAIIIIATYLAVSIFAFFIVMAACIAGAKADRKRIAAQEKRSPAPGSNPARRASLGHHVVARTTGPDGRH